jgi:hypothetical protein
VPTPAATDSLDSLAPALNTQPVIHDDLTLRMTPL